ncbi:unnamed protein product [Diamesa hyperborea]
MWILFVLCVTAVAANDNLRVAYQWKQMDFEYPNIDTRQAAIQDKSFIQENIIPVGLEVYKDRLFITLPRWKTGVPASLAYIDLNDNSTKSPLLKPYPSWSAHRLVADEVPEIISPFRVRADRCGRLWVLDTGVVDILGEPKKLSATQLLIYDLHNDNLLRRYPFPASHTKSDSFFANIAVEDDDCDNSFAYSGDLGVPGLVVYSWKSESSWRVTHHYFHPDPLAGNYSIGGTEFQWDDGLFGLALSKPLADGFPTLYFHPFSSTNEFSVSTKILRNETLATSTGIYNDFKILGSRGSNGQSSVEFLDKKTGVLFYTLPNLNAIACWRTTNKAYTIKAQGRIFMDSSLMVFPNDVKVDDQSRLWVLSDRLQQFMYKELDANEINFRILTASVADAIDHTACDTKTKALPDIINRLGDILKPATSTTMTPSKSSATKFPIINSTLLLLLVSIINALT